MDYLLAVTLLICLIVVLFAIDRSRSQGNRQRIALFLQSKGASNIVVSKVWFSGDRGNFVYNAEYVDRQGQPHTVQCKINSGWFSDDEIFWSAPPEV